jgi:hypothetical protein
MTDSTRASGRHRAARRRSPVLWGELAQAVRRPSRRGLVKTSGCLLAAVGVVSAWSAPAAIPALALVDAPTGDTTTTVTAPAAALARPEAFGEIGFKAVPKPSASSPLDGRDRQSVSRSAIRRTGLRGELGLTQHGLIVLNAIRDNFPQVTSFGGYRPGDMDHGTGNAVDAMVSSRATGDAVASYVMAHAAELNVKYIIWYQRIWYPSSGTWKYMEDRGSITANHMDHVHVSVN